MTARTRIRLKQVQQQAEGYLELGMSQHALDALVELGNAADSSSHALYLRGEALRQMGRYGEALVLLERAAKLAPEELHISLAAGWCYKRTARIDLAIEVLQHALTVAPGDSMHPSLTATPGGFFVAWMDESSGPLNIFAAALDGDGTPEGYPAAIGDTDGTKEYPCALLDSREPGYPDQNMIAYVQRTSGEDNKIFLTAAGPNSTAMDRGVELLPTAVNIKHAAVSGEGDSRAALWAEGDYTEKELYFTVLECM